MSILFQPARAHRRTIMGQPCQSCGLRMHHADIVAVRTDDALIYMHEPCALAVFEQLTAETDAS